MNEAILERLLDCCDSYEITGPWGFLTGDANCRGCLRDGPATLELLVREYSEESLVSAGVARREADGSLCLVDSLVAAPGGLVALRDTPNQPPDEILLGSGCLSGRALPITAIERDHYTAALLQRVRGPGKLLFVPCGIDDLVLLRALKLPATLAVGLDQVKGDQLDQLCSRYGWNSSVSNPLAETSACRGFNDEESEQPRIRALSASLMGTGGANDGAPLVLVLVGFSLARLKAEEPRGLAGVTGHLARIERYLELDLSRVCVWKPSHEDLERLRFLVGMSDARAIRRAVIDSVMDSSYSLAAFCDPSSGSLQAPTDYLGARTMLDRLRQEPHRAGKGSDQVRRAEAVVQQMAERDLVRPLIEKAQCCDDPLERNLYAVSAELARQVHHGGMSLAEHTGAQGEGRAEAQADEDQRSKRFFRSVDRFLAVARELRE